MTGTAREMRPFPEGTLVMPGIGRAFRWECETHAYRVTSAVPAKGMASGFAQGASCLVCGHFSGPVDSGWWSRPLTEQQARLAAECIQDDLDRMTAALDAMAALTGSRDGSDG